jgi:PhzF family phenazine biosynthesis protein
MTANADRIDVLLVDAFTDEPLTGNAAGVVPEAEGLADDQRLAIARELGASETAFLSGSDRADRRIRYFTPTTEVDLCGHATVASHAYLLGEGVIEPGVHSLETSVGVLEIRVTESGVVWMSQDEPRVERVGPGYDRIADALGIDPDALTDVGGELPVALASTGLSFLVVPMAFLEGVGGIDPDLAAVEALCSEVGATGLYAFTFDTLEAESTLHGRMFAPGAGVDEDPVTGTASGAVGAYLRQFEAFGSEFPDEMRFEQGHFLDRPGEVRVRLDDGVRVGGRAVTALSGALRVPEADDDGIREA